MKQFKKLLSSVLALGLVLGCALPISATAAKTFTDTKGHWAASFITKGVDHGYINGYENGSFRPNNSVSRAEFCKMINNALDLSNLVTLNFSDVKSSDWFFSEVSKSVGSGYISGYEDGTFRANNPITRQEAAVVISRIVADPTQQKDLSALKDASSIESWAQSGAKSVFSKGYMAGDNKKNFNPKGNLTRGESVKILESILSGETFQKTDLALTTNNQTVSNTIYTGKLTLQGTGSATFQNCRVLGKMTLPSDATLRLQDTKVGNLALTGTGGTAQIIAAGASEIATTNLSAGATLTENALSGAGFRDLVFNGTALKSQPVYLSGNFDRVDVNSPANLYLRSGGMSHVRMNKGATDSRIDLFANTNVKKLELFVPAIFTGKGTISLAVQHVSGSSFETPPLKTEGQAATKVLTPTVKPANGTTGISTDTTIDLTFDEITYTNTTGLVTPSYAENDIFELRSGSETGTKVSFSATLTNNNRNYSLKPSNLLASNTRYYLIIKAGSMTNSLRASNAKQVFSFTTTTQATQKVTPYPADGATGIPVGTLLKLSFDEAVYQNNGSTSLTASYLKNSVLELRRDSTTGREVDFTASISSDRRTITLTTNSNLSTSTRYYLILRGNTIASSGRTSLAGQAFSFTTASSDVLVPAMTPSPASNEVSPNTDLTLEFDTALYTSSGNTSVSAAYLEDNVFSLRRDSANGTAVNFTASINSNRSTVTITPRSDLQNGVTYYLTMLADTLCNASGSSRRYNDKLVLSFTVDGSTQNGSLAPTITPRNAASGVSTNSDITLEFSRPIYQSNSNSSDLTASYLRNTVLELRTGSATGSSLGFSASISSNRRVITITPNSRLSNNTRYYVIMNNNTIQNDNGVKNDRFTSYFTVGTTLSYLAPTVTPSNGATGVARDPSISVNFSEQLFDKNDNLLSNTTASRNYLQRYAFELHQDREGGSSVGFEVDTVVSNRNITIKPTVTLTTGKTYYLVLVEGQLRDTNGRQNERQVFSFTVGGGLSVTTSPSNGASGISRNTSIDLSYGDTLYNTSGSRLYDFTNSELYRYLSSYITLSTSGNSSVSYSLSMPNNKTIRISPDSTLLPNRSYTVSLSSGRISDGSSITNSALNFSFSTANNQLTPTFSPSNGATSRPTNQAVTINFGENIYVPGTNRIVTASDVPSIVELREGSTGGRLVSTSASVSSNRSIILTPTETLKNGTSYYTVLRANSVASSSNAAGSNAAQNAYFTTATASNLGNPTASISAGKIDSSGKSQTVSLNFPTSVFKADKSALDVAYISSNLKLSKNSNGSTPIEPTAVTISGSSIDLTVPLLDPGSNYYLIAAANVFSDSSGNKNQAFAVSATAPSLVVSLDVSSVTKDSATATVTSNYPIIMELRLNQEPPIYGPGTPLSNSFTKEMMGLTSGTNYELTLSYRINNSSATQTQKKSFRTESVSSDTSLTALTVNDGQSIFNPFENSNDTDVRRTVASGTISLSPNVHTSKATASVSGSAGLTGSGNNYTLALSSGDTANLTITVTAENGTSKTYSLTLTAV